MYINNRILSLVYKVILLSVCLIGIALISGWTKGAFSDGILNYYTIQSNLLVFVYFVILTVKILFDLKKKGIHGITAIFPSFKGAVTLAITVTFLVYHFMLSASGFAMAGTNSRYPYFFIDIDKYGSAVALNVVFLAIGFLVLGFIIVGIDHLLKKKTKFH